MQHNDRFQRVPVLVLFLYSLPDRVELGARQLNAVQADQEAVGGHAGGQAADVVPAQQAGGAAGGQLEDVVPGGGVLAGLEAVEQVI